MANTTIKLKVDDENVVFTSSPPVFSGDVNTISAAFEFGANWDGLTKYAVFYRTIDNPYMVALTDDECLVPHEVMQTSGRMYIGVYGVQGDKQKTSEVVFYDLGTGVLAGGMESGDTLALWQEILKKIDDIETISANVDAHVQQAVEAANIAIAQATEASGYASTASQKATEASTSESNALQYKTDAETAKTQAETAKAGAETARDQAETKVQEAINEMTAEITASINDALSPRIVESATGETVTVDDASGARLAGLKLYGKATQDGTPSPENHMPIEVAGSDGSIDVDVYGANICNPQIMIVSFQQCTTSVDGVTVIISPLSDGDVYAGEVINITEKWHKDKSALSIVKGLKRLKITIDNAWANKNYYGFFDKNLTSLGYQKFTSTSATFDVPENAVYASFRVGNGETKLSDGVQRVKVMVTPVSYEGDYVPFDKQPLTVTTPNGLPGIPVESGGNYTDAEGQQWVSDVIDCETEKKIQNIEYVNAKDLNWTLNTAWTNDNLAFFYNSVNSQKGIYADKVLCNKLKSVSFTRDYSSFTEEAIMVQKSLYNGVAVSSIYLVIKKDRLQTVDNDGLRDYLQTAGIMILKTVHNPVETSLSAEEITAYKALHTNAGVTNIFTDSEPQAGIELDYIADTKMYIDKRIDAIATQVLDSIAGE